MSYLSDLLGKAYKEGMTEDEISTALESIGNSADTELNRLKTALSKANSEAADYKKQLRKKQTDDEANEANQKEELEKWMNKCKELEHSKLIADNKSELIAMGYDEKLALETATAYADGDMKKVMANQSIFLESQKKAILADAMRKTPRPVAGEGTGDGIDYDAKIAEARKNCDYSAIAYYTRLKAQESTKTD